MPTWGWKRMFEAKLTAAQKDEIFERAIFEGESDAALAETYQVSPEDDLAGDARQKAHCPEEKHAGNHARTGADAH